MRITEERSWSEAGPCNETEVRVLLVDDHQEFREFESVILKTMPEMGVIGEAATGWAAIEAARKIQPHLVLLDINLPDITGLEAAPAIRKAAPDSKILFVTSQSSHGIADAALSVGGSGLVVKHKALSDLPIATKAALQGERFVSEFVM